MDGCTELLVTHEDGQRSCVNPACESPDPVRHDWRVDCSDLDEPCGDCTEAAPRSVARPRRAA